MQNIFESVFTLLAFISLFVLFFLGSWEMELPPRENYLHWLEWGICLNLRVQWYLLRSWMCLSYKEWNRRSVLWSLGVGKTELGLRSNSKRDKVSKETMQKVSYVCSLCHYLMHLFYKHLLPSPVQGTWDVKVIQPFGHLSKSSCQWGKIKVVGQDSRKRPPVLEERQWLKKVSQRSWHLSWSSGDVEVTLHSRRKCFPRMRAKQAQRLGTS